MATAEHTVKAFDLDLMELTRMIAEMGGHAERQIVEAVAALSKRDRRHGERMISGDAALDSQQREIEQKAIETIATSRRPTSGWPTSSPAARQPSTCCG